MSGQLFGPGDLVLRIVPSSLFEPARCNKEKIEFSPDGKRIRVKESVTVGRLGDIAFNGPPRISRVHCKLIRELTHWKLRVEGQNGMAVYTGIIKRLKQGEEIILKEGYGIMVTSDMRGDFIVE